MALVDAWTDEELDRLLERYDQTEPKLQRKIVVELMLRRQQARVDECRACVSLVVDRLAIATDLATEGALRSILEKMEQRLSLECGSEPF